MPGNRSIQLSVIRSVIENEPVFILVIPEFAKGVDGNPTWSCAGRTRTHIKGIAPADSDVVVLLLRNLANAIEETGISAGENADAST